MRKVFTLIFSFCIVIICYSQSISNLKQRFNTYLNFKGSLNSIVSFTDKSVSILKNNNAEFTLFNDELSVFAQLATQLPQQQFTFIYNWKKNTHLITNQLDSLLKLTNPTLPKTNNLIGKKIALDAGHFAGNMQTAKIEQKYLEFLPDNINKLKDTIRFNEGTLTYQTAHILKQQLEQQGAIVFVTRPAQNFTSFKITYDDWFTRKRNQTFDSLVNVNAIDVTQKNKLLKLTKQKLFWEFFRDFELLERARIINEFKPDITIIIHYNVDEKNTDWKKPTTKNFTMTFIGGAITADNFNKQQNKNHFLRLLLSNQLNESEKLSQLTVNQFNKKLNIPIAQQNDADYLKNNCISTSSNGVYCRNLALCRNVNSVLVYGEALYQDNENECINLNNPNTQIYGIKTPSHIIETANCYFNAINMYFSNAK